MQQQTIRVQQTIRIKTPSSKLCEKGKYYPVLGDIIIPDNHKIFDEFYEKKLSQNWDCLEKARITLKHIRKTKIKTPILPIIEIGSLTIWNSEWTSNFQYLYNPPLEFHAWVYLGNEIIVDYALGGAIEEGLNLRDDVGSFLEGRTPVVLSGTPPEWLEYNVYMTD